MISNSTPPIVENIKKEDDPKLTENFSKFFPFKCKTCKITFEKASDVKIHTCQIIEAHLFHCKHCNNDYNKRELLEEHIYSGTSCSKLGKRDQTFIGKFSLLDFGI